MIRLLNVIQKLQPLIIAVAVFFIVVQYISNDEKDTFIEDREASFKKFEDSITAKNQYLYDQNLQINGINEVLGSENDSLRDKTISLDNSLKKMKDDYIKDRNGIGTLNADETVNLLSRNLSK